MPADIPVAQIHHIAVKHECSCAATTLRVIRQVGKRVVPSISNRVVYEHRGVRHFKSAAFPAAGDPYLALVGDALHVVCLALRRETLSSPCVVGRVEFVDGPQLATTD
jgi:hypothetical protein